MRKQDLFSLLNEAIAQGLVIQDDWYLVMAAMQRLQGAVGIIVVTGTRGGIVCKVTSSDGTVRIQRP